MPSRIAVAASVAAPRFRTVLLGLFALVLLWGFSIALRCQHHFGRLIALGVTSMMFLYVFINTGMVMGLLPVVGVPLPLVSYGGTSLVTICLGMGILMSIQTHKKLVQS